MLPSETMIWQPEFTDKTLSRKPGAVQEEAIPDIIKTIEQKQGKPGLEYLDRFGKTIPW